MRLTRRLPIILMIALALSIAAPFAAADNNQNPTIVVGSTNFPEQLILAHIYADVLAARGVNVDTRLNLGSREIVFPALKAGDINLLPEYTGALLAYLATGDVSADTPEAVTAALRKALPTGITALQPAPAQDKDALVVTQATASKHDLHTISDLQGVAPKLVIGGPPELKTRASGLPGLKQVYGLSFKRFRALDAGGPLTVAALTGGDIDVARMFTTQGIIDAKGWIVLKDDKNLVLPQNLVPIIRKDAVTKTVRSALNDISSRLTTATLQKLNRKVSVDKRSPSVVAAHWVEAQGLGD